MGEGGGEERGTKGFGVVLTWVLEVWTILEGDTQGFHLLKGEGHTKFYPVLRVGGGQKVRTRDFPILYPGSPMLVINDQSLQWMLESAGSSTEGTVDIKSLADNS